MDAPFKQASPWLAPLITTSAVLAIFSIIIYIAGSWFLSKKMFSLGATKPPKPLSAKIKSVNIFLAIFLPLCATAAVFSIVNFDIFGIYPKLICHDEKRTSLCSWPIRQCWVAIGKDKRDSCYSDIAISKASDVIDNAIEKRDASICEKNINEIDKKDICYNAIAHATHDWSLCDKITTQTSKHGCYCSKAVSEKEPSLCEQCSDKGWASNYANCYYKIASAKQDPSICGLVNDSESKCFCYNRMAEDLGDLLLCDQCRNCITCRRVPPYEKCLSDVAEVKQDQSICDTIQDQETKNDCYYWVADRKKDASVCTAISDQFTKNKCYRNAGEK